MTPRELEEYREVLGEVIGFDPEILCQYPNVILKRGENVSIFEYVSPGVYEGHYLFKDRTTTFVDAKDMLTELFSTVATVVRGLTPVENKRALQVTARLGFTDHGEIETMAGLMRLSILTKKEFMNE